MRQGKKRKMMNGAEGSMTQGARSSGKMHTTHSSILSFIYDKQIEFQREIVGAIQLPQDSKEWFVYHTAAMIEELGELLKADKRWKTHRNAAYDRTEKLAELADVFITAMNLGIYSGFEGEEIINAVYAKIDENTARLAKRERENTDGK